MKTPRIEEMVEEVASVCDEVEFLHGVPVKLPSQTKALLRGKIRKALTKAHQAGIHEMVQRLQKLPYGTNGDGKQWVMKKDLDDTIKALQDNK